MSPLPCARLLSRVCFPRVSGDEPAPADNRKEADMFSPRERG